MWRRNVWRSDRINRTSGFGGRKRYIYMSHDGNRIPRVRVCVQREISVGKARFPIPPVVQVKSCSRPSVGFVIRILNSIGLRIGYFCPPGSAQPQAVQKGYYATNGPSVITSAEERQCELGHFCVDGIQHPCPFGR